MVKSRPIPAELRQRLIRNSVKQTKENKDK